MATPGTREFKKDEKEREGQRPVYSVLSTSSLTSILDAKRSDTKIDVLRAHRVKEISSLLTQVIFVSEQKHASVSGIENDLMIIKDYFFQDPTLFHSLELKTSLGEIEEKRSIFHEYLKLSQQVPKPRLNITISDVLQIIHAIKKLDEVIQTLESQKQLTIEIQIKRINLELQCITDVLALAKLDDENWIAMLQQALDISSGSSNYRRLELYLRYFLFCIRTKNLEEINNNLADFFGYSPTEQNLQDLLSSLRSIESYLKDKNLTLYQEVCERLGKQLKPVTGNIATKGASTDAKDAKVTAPSKESKRNTSGVVILGTNNVSAARLPSGYSSPVGQSASASGGNIQTRLATIHEVDEPDEDKPDEDKPIKANSL